MHFHQKIYDYLLSYRKTIDPNFNFIVRQRASLKDKNYIGGKFAHGIVFQGTNDYCFVGLVDKSGGANATKSVGLVVFPTDKGFKLTFEIVFPGEINQELIKFYKALANRFEKIIWDGRGVKANYTIGEFPEEDPSLLFDWLKVNYPIIKQEAKASNIPNLIPNEEKFNQLQDNLKSKLKEALNQTIHNQNPNSDAIKEEFSNWLKGKESNKINSYLRAIDILNEILNTDLYLNHDRKGLNSLYEDLIKEQKKVDGKYYYEAAPSYGVKGFYSASIWAFISFLKEKYRMKIFSDFKIYLNQFNFTEGTIGTYVNSVEHYVPLEWKKLYKEDFSNFKYTIANLKKIKPILNKNYQGVFKGKNNFNDFLNFLISNFKADLQMKIHKKNPTINQILYGPPGTGKTYATKEKAVSIIDSDFIKNIDANLSKTKKRKLISDKYEELYNIGQIVFTTFHQSMSYEDFVEGIKPKTINNKVIYDIEDGVFKQISDIAMDNWEASKNVLDKEIAFDDAFKQLKEDWEENDSIQFPMKTEGNAFTIIGFTNKSIQFKKASGGTGHTLSINTLREGFYNERKIRSTGVGIYYPSILERLKNYKSKQTDSISLKPYVLIIDEINRGNVSAIFGELITLLEPDKRIGESEALHIKLPYSKLDFGVPSNLHIIGTMNTADRSVEALDTALRRRFEFKEMMPDYRVIDNEYVEGVELNELLQTINERIEILIDRDHTIGHSYFVGVDTEQKLANAFNNKIVPLLQEYFYGDYGKIGLVLGKGFVEKIKNDKIDFAAFDYENANDFKTPSFKLKQVDASNIIDAIAILYNMPESVI